MKVVVAMSGGVDSSTTAALLKEEGHEVIGMTMRLWPPRGEEHGSSNVCCGLDAIEDARRVAHELGIPHYVMDLSALFTRTVVDYFCREYSLGRTPNPCIRCNRYVKFSALLEKTRETGATAIATGHYARVEKDENAVTHLLKKGADTQKDQSYFLYLLTQEQLGHTLFPLGNLTKNRVRQIATELNLPVADKAESQEICFIPDNDYAGFVKDYVHAARKRGPILDNNGNFRGEHEGIMNYTIGQRKGLGIAASEPLYVTAIEPEQNAVIVGTREQTFSDELVASDINWISKRLESKIEVKAKIRYRHPEAEATVTPIDNDAVFVKFTEPQLAITPGQAIVFYEGDNVIGGGTITRQGS